MPSTGPFLIVMFALPWVFICMFGCGLIKETLQKSGVIKVKPAHPDYLKTFEHVDAKPLGAGACGAAWKVKKIGTDEIFVAKEFSGSDADVKNVFEPEAKYLPLLKHPGIVQTYEIYGTGESGSVIIMDYIDGNDLA